MFERGDTARGTRSGDLSGFSELQTRLFNEVDHRTALPEDITAQIFYFGDLKAVGPDVLRWTAENMELVLRDCATTSPRWFASHEGILDCLVVHAEYFSDVEDTVDFCMAVREAAPWLPILLLSTEVRESDLSSERMMACDATVKLPASPRSLSEGMHAAFQNHRTFQAAVRACGTSTKPDDELLSP